MRIALRASLLSIFGSALLSTSTFAAEALPTNSFPEVNPKLLMSRDHRQLLADVLNDEVADSSARNNAVIRHTSVSVPVEAVPTPSAWSAGVITLLALAGMQFARRAKFAR